MNQVLTKNTDNNLINNTNYSNLVELLRYRAAHQGNQIAFKFLESDDGTEQDITYQQLDNQARAIAVYLQQKSQPGDRVLLLYPPGIDYIAAFFGCLYAELIAIPLYPPKNSKKMSRIQTIMEDSQAQISLTNHQSLINAQLLLKNAPELQKLVWIATDKIDENLAQDWQPKSINSRDIAYLQYISGSTSTPKGVMISHHNALCNSAEIAVSWKTGADSILVSWLPHFHDFGQIYGVIQPIYNGFPCIFMSPASFTQKPIRWLQAISDYKATHSGAPNFAYDLCVDKIQPEQKENLDLSSWQVTVNGAEPVRRKTLEKFHQTFAPYGFRWSTFYPGYGLAEATLKVSSARNNNSPTILNTQADSLSQNLIVATTENNPFAKKLVGCGKTVLNSKVVIVNPQSFTPCPENQIGEIWVSGPSIAEGYWNRKEETERTFGAYLDNGEGPFLRTGDLGFLRDEELFITGRIKDLIVIRGSNHYPQDIELTVEESHPSLRSGYSAAFAIEEQEQEKLVIVCEIERTHLRKLNSDEIIRAIRQTVSRDHELEIYAISLLKTASIPKTSSGKIQRRACHTQFLSDELDVVHEWKDTTNTHTGNQGKNIMSNNLSNMIKLGVQDWIITWISNEKKIDFQAIDANQPLDYYSLSSLDSMNLHGDLESWLGYSIIPDWLWESPSIEVLAHQIAQARIPGSVNKAA